MRFWVERVQQGARDVILAGDVGKLLWPILASQNLITHAIKDSLGLTIFDSGSRWDCIVPGCAAAEVENVAATLVRLWETAQLASRLKLMSLSHSAIRSSSPGSKT